MYTEKSSRATIKDYIFLHLSILMFSFTSVFTKMASNEFALHGIWGIKLYVFLFLMLLDCFVYAIVWQKVIKNFDLSIAYANKSIYLIWTQLWAVVIFGESLSLRNVAGLALVFAGVLVVQGKEE